MAHFNGSSTEGKSSHESGEGRRWQWFSTLHLPMALAGLVIAGLFVGVEGCSKNGGNTVASSQPAISAPAPAMAPATPTVPPPAPMAKKAHHARRHRAAIITYANNDYGVSFRYPRKYDLKLGDEAQLAWPGLGSVQTGFVKAGGATVAAVEMPDNSYPGTDFASGFVNLSVNSGLTEQECMQFASNGKDGVSDPAKIEVGKLEFTEVEQVTGQDLKQADVKYFHAFQNGACYEFALGVGTVGDDAAQDVAEVDRGEVFGKLEKILSSVHFKPVEVPITAEPADSQKVAPPPGTAPTAVPSVVLPVVSDRT